MKAPPIKPMTAARCVLGLVLLGLLSGCSNGPSWGAWSKRPTDAQIAAALGQPVQPAPVQSYAMQR